jgi:hypothetical protein
MAALADRINTEYDDIIVISSDCGSSEGDLEDEEDCVIVFTPSKHPPTGER